jgi:dihydropteroate synthase
VIELNKKTLIMGILNITPDSFSDGGFFIRLKTQSATQKK